MLSRDKNVVEGDLVRLEVGRKRKAPFFGFLSVHAQDGAANAAQIPNILYIQFAVVGKAAPFSEQAAVFVVDRPALDGVAALVG